MIWGWDTLPHSFFFVVGLLNRMKIIYRWKLHENKYRCSGFLYSQWQWLRCHFAWHKKISIFGYHKKLFSSIIYLVDVCNTCTYYFQTIFEEVLNSQLNPHITNPLFKHLIGLNPFIYRLFVFTIKINFCYTVQPAYFLIKQNLYTTCSNVWNLIHCEALDMLLLV